MKPMKQSTKLRLQFLFGQLLASVVMWPIVFAGDSAFATAPIKLRIGLVVFINALLFLWAFMSSRPPKPGVRSPWRVW